MRKRDILKAELEPDGVKLTSKDGRVAVARFASQIFGRVNAETEENAGKVP